MTAPLVIAFTNTKGGVSKSTLAAHLVLWLWDLGVRVALLDADGKQNSSGAWIQNAEPSVPVRVATKAEEIQAKIAELALVADVVVCDTPGHASDAAHAVTLLCDIAVVPLQPSKLDVRAIRGAFQFVFLAQEVSNGNRARPFVVLTHTGKRDVQAKRLRNTITESLGVPVLKAQMRRLAAFLDSPDTSVQRMRGPQAANAAYDINAIFQELLGDRLADLIRRPFPRAAHE